MAQIRRRFTLSDENVTLPDWMARYTLLWQRLAESDILERRGREGEGETAKTLRRGGGGKSALDSETDVWKFLMFGLFWHWSSPATVVSFN